MNGQLKQTTGDKAEKIAIIILVIFLVASVGVGYFFAAAIGSALNS